MFCRRYRCLTVATLLGISIASGAATAQPRDDQRRGQELMGLIREGLAADDPEVIIARMTAARQLEPQLRGWPLEMPRDRAKGLINGVLANGYKDRQAGDPEQNIAAAIAAYRQALGSLSAKTFPNDFAVTQKNLCNILNRKYSLPTGTRNDQEAALEACNAALTVYDPRSNPQAWADTLIDLGSIYSERSRDGVGRNLTSAVRAYRAAANVYTKEQAAQKWALIQYNIGVVYYTQSNKDSAVPMSDLLTGLRRDNLNFAFQGPVFYRGLDAYSQQKAIDAIKASLSVYTKDQFPAEFARSHNSLAVLFHEGNRRDEQIVSARAALGFYTAERDLAAHLRLTNLLAQGLMLKGDWPEAAKAYTAARKAYTALVGERPQLARAIAANFGPMHTEAAYVALQLGDPWGALRIMEDQSLGLFPGLAAEDPAVLARRVIPVGGIAIMPVITNAGAKLLTLTRPTDGPAAIAAEDVANVDLPLMATTIRDWLRAFNIQYLPAEAKAAAMPLWLDAIEGIGPQQSQLFGAAIAGLVARHGLRPGARLIWMPSALQAVLPIGLIVDPGTGERIGDRFEISYAPGLHVLAHAAGAATAPARSLAMIVNPTGEEKELDLPFTELEGEVIANHFDAAQRSALGKTSADAAQVLAALRGKSFWHFASHGEFDWDAPAKSGLLMRGRQRLSIERFVDPDQRLGRPRLVVLSACETGIYDMRLDPQAFQGLPGAFLRLGAGGVLASLWQVDDVATALLMVRFYDALLDGGQSPAAALKSAQAWLREATAFELLEYAGAQTTRSSIMATLLPAIEGAVTRGQRAGGSRNAAGWRAMQTRSAPGSAAATTTMTGPGRRPFAHPYYWGGFVLTGL